MGAALELDGAMRVSLVISIVLLRAERTCLSWRTKKGVDSSGHVDDLVRIDQRRVLSGSERRRSSVARDSGGARVGSVAGMTNPKPRRPVPSKRPSVKWRAGSETRAQPQGRRPDVTPVWGSDVRALDGDGRGREIDE
jgi:hypothetical protein